MQLGAAFTAAAQLAPLSEVTQAAMYALNLLVHSALTADITTSNTSSGGLGSSIREQLRQSGVLQQLSAVLAAMTAKLQAETAFLTSGQWDAASGDVERFAAADAVQARFAAVAGFRALLWATWEDQESSAGWMWGANGQAEAVLLFATVGLQHISSIVKYVLPAVRRRTPQLAAWFVPILQTSSQVAGTLCRDAANIAPQTPSQQHGQGQGSRADAWQQLLLLPHLLPCVAIAVVLCVSEFGMLAAAHHAPVGSSSDSSSSSSSSKAPGGSSIDRSSSSIRDFACGTVTVCPLQLLQLLGLTHDVADWAVPPNRPYPVVYDQLLSGLGAFTDCYAASKQLLRSSSSIGSGESGEQQQQQRWQFEQQLWQLLTAVLLPCASSLLLPGAQHPTQDMGRAMVRQLLVLSTMAAQLSSQLYKHLQCRGIPSANAPAFYVNELLGVLLQLADRLLYQQPLLLADAVPEAAAAATPATSGSSGSSAGPSLPALRAFCAKQLLPLLVCVAQDSHALFCGPSSNDTRSDSCSNNSHGDRSNSAAAAACEADGVPPLAAKLVEFLTALEAVLRAMFGAQQSGTANITSTPTVTLISLESLGLLSINGQGELMQHMGLRGSVVLAQEQQQLYSLLSTLQKPRRCIVQWKESQDLFVHMAVASSCKATALAAVGLLEMTSIPGGSAVQDQQLRPSPEAAAAAAGGLPAAQPAVSYLPSLVIFGRCLLQWAEQLQQKGPGLVLLGPRELEHQLKLYKDSEASVCLPELRKASAVTPGGQLESLAAAVRQWVGGISISSPAQAQLAAAGCSPPQLQQQLDALLSAQQGTHQGLTDASLAALVQQLQVTGAMLSSIAVPHFCNNPACADLSGPTEVRLVSGRSCICAGCRIARYCGRACQRAAWKQHKPVCKALAAAAVSAATAEGS